MIANSRYSSSHELARRILAEPDMPVAVGRDLGLYQASAVDFRVHPDGKRLLFNADRKVAGETQERVFWISGPLI